MSRKITFIGIDLPLIAPGETPGEGPKPLGWGKMHVE
jgi:hypothetical protein